MIAVSLLLAVSAGAAPALPAPDAAPLIVASAARARSGPAARLPGFAAQLADSPAINGPRDWPLITPAAAWARLATATPATRQAARWAWARSLIGNSRGQEALGVLDTMRADEPDLVLVDNFRLALGAARAEAGDPRGALTALASAGAGSGQLAENPEACAWRLWSLASIGEAAAALAEVRCSMPALNARPLAARTPFLYAGARAALAGARPAAVALWLAALPDGDAGANLYRGRAALALGEMPAARLRLARVKGGSRQQMIDAEVSLLESAAASGPVTPTQLARIDRLALLWRGDAIEQRVLHLSYRIGRDRQDLRRALAAGAALVRHHPVASGSQQVLAELQDLLARGLERRSRLPVSQAAGLYWEYRDIAPVGARGDYLVSQLATRLQDVGLHLRAAELLRHQLTARTRDIAQGPLSAQVAGLYIQAGKPDVALQLLRGTDGPAYPAPMRWQRQRVAAAALVRLGRLSEALAVVQDLPDAALMRAEILWQGRNWPALAAELAPQLPQPTSFGDVGRAIVLRHAIALAMLGREAELAQLRERYLRSFNGQSGTGSFDLLTRDVASLTPEALTTAITALPSTSPVGAIGDLLDRPGARPNAASAAVSADNRRG